jgi:hypothetical protein
MMRPTHITTAEEIRKLAQRIRELNREAPCMAVTGRVIRECTDHLDLLAIWYEHVMERAK